MQNQILGGIMCKLRGGGEANFVLRPKILWGPSKTKSRLGCLGKGKPWQIGSLKEWAPLGPLVPFKGDGPSGVPGALPTISFPGNPLPPPTQLPIFLIFAQTQDFLHFYSIILLVPHFDGGFHHFFSFSHLFRSKNPSFGKIVEF